MNFPESNEIISTRLIIEDGRNIALLQRAPTGELQGSWELPGGKIDPGEELDEAVMREAFEETGLKIELSNLFPELVEDRIITDVCKHQNKAYKSFVFIGRALSRKIVIRPDEHTDHIWVPSSEALSMSLTQTSRNAIQKMGPLLLGGM